MGSYRCRGRAGPRKGSVWYFFVFVLSDLTIFDRAGFGLTKNLFFAKIGILSF